MSHRAGVVLIGRVVAPPHQVVDPLLAWSATHLRDLPWRRSRDPWAVLVSEVMLQQTQVARVIDRWHEFLARFPTVTDCADATAADVIGLWAGLGYNRRAVNLWRAAVHVRDGHGGRMPSDVAGLLALPGVGPYTARAVAAFAYELDVGVVDTNVGRLLARWTGATLNAREAQAIADDLVPAGGGWRWNQSLFDFAVAVCTKRSPECAGCPLTTACVWSGVGDDPADASAGVSARQSRFEGSRRQVRGRLLDALRVGPIAPSRLATFGRPTDTSDDLNQIVASMVRDGLVVERDGELRLPS
ncbi:MAG: A/G-specific adenine glycosylase [Actinomycetota bacterium]